MSNVVRSAQSGRLGTVGVSPKMVILQKARTSGEGSRCENQRQLRRIANGLRNNYFGTPEL